MSVTIYKDTTILGKLTTSGGRYSDVAILYASDNIISTDEFIVCNKTTALTVSLPASTGSGRKLCIKNIGTGVTTVDPDGTDLIDDSTSLILGQWDSVQLVDADNGLWIIV